MLIFLGGLLVTVVFVWIHCMENATLLFHNDVLSESKWRFLCVFSLLPRKLYIIFQPTFFLI